MIKNARCSIAIVQNARWFYSFIPLLLLLPLNSALVLHATDDSSFVTKSPKVLQESLTWSTTSDGRIACPSISVELDFARIGTASRSQGTENIEKSGSSAPYKLCFFCTRVDSARLPSPTPNGFVGCMKPPAVEQWNSGISINIKPDWSEGFSQ